MKKAVCAGHICIDLTPLFPGDFSGDALSRLIPGKLLQTRGMDIHTGGSVANTGLAMKRLGADVQLQGKIGGDAMGALVRSALEEENAAEGLLLSEGSTTSYSVVLAMPGIDRIFLHDPGANATFCCEDMNWDAIEQAHLLHFGYPPLMRRLFMDGGSELIRIFKKAKELGVVTSLDMASPDPDSEGGRVDWRSLLSELLPYVDFFLPSAEELAYMLRRDMYHRWISEAGQGDATDSIRLADAELLAQDVLDMGAGLLLLKCGSRGLYFRSASPQRLSGVTSKLELCPDQWASMQGFEESFMPEQIVSATGAGDTCIAAFLTSVLRGYGLRTAVSLAAAEGASCVRAIDALSGILPLEQLEEMILKGWKKNACQLK